MAHRFTSASGLRCFCHRRAFGTLKEPLGFPVARPASPVQNKAGAAVYNATSVFASEPARLTFGALFRLSQVAAKTISAPTNTQICSGSL
jgi:hypothetical protein